MSFRQSVILRYGTFLCVIMYTAVSRLSLFSSSVPYRLWHFLSLCNNCTLHYLRLSVATLHAVSSLYPHAVAKAKYITNQMWLKISKIKTRDVLERKKSSLVSYEFKDIDQYCTKPHLALDFAVDFLKIKKKERKKNTCTLTTLKSIKK